MKRRGVFFFSTGLVGMLAAGWLGFPALLYRPVNQPIQFSHKVHTGEGAGLSCEDCHAIGEDGSFAGLPAIEKCATCHSAQIGTSPAESLLVSEYVSPNREIPWLVYSGQPAHVYFPHIKHVKVAKIPCERCHGDRGVSEVLPLFRVDRVSGYSRDLRGSYMDDCSACHRTRGVQESCLDCHQ